MDILALRYRHTDGMASPRQYINTPEKPTSGVCVGMMNENAVANTSPRSQSVGRNLPLRQNMNSASRLHSRWKTLPWTKWKVRWVHHGEWSVMPHPKRKPPAAIAAAIVTNAILSLVVMYRLHQSVEIGIQTFWDGFVYDYVIYVVPYLGKSLCKFFIFPLKTNLHLLKLVCNSHQGFRCVSVFSVFLISHCRLISSPTVLQPNLCMPFSSPRCRWGR